MSFDDTNPLTGAYPGNPALPKEVREKILTTFRHALTLFREGKTDDCHIGCDFILKMDPRFAPARQLMEKVKNPNADVDLDRLEAVLKSAPAPQARPSSPDVERLLVRAAESLAARDFDAAIAAAQQILSSLPNNRQAQELMEKARGKRDGQADIERARQKAIEALEAGRVSDARRALQHMKAIDADHPSVALLERRIQSAPPEEEEAPSLSSAMDFSSPSGLESVLASSGSSEPDIQFGMADPEPVAAPPPPPRLHGGGAPQGLDGLSLDSLSLDGPDTRVVPPSGGRKGSPLDAAPGSPADMWGAGPDLAEEAASPIEAPAFPSGPPPPPMYAPEPEPEVGGGGSDPEIETLLRQGDEAAERGDRQQAIEIWSRIFLMDINNSDAVERIERARQDMAEGNRVVSDGLKAGRDAFEAGEFAVARERFLKVLAVDENEPTARFYMDRIEEEIHRKAAEHDAAPTPALATAEPAAVVAEKSAAKPKAKRGGMKMPSIPGKVLALVAVFLLIAGGAAFFLLRAPKRPGAGPAAGGAAAAPAEASFERALALMKEGKDAEALAELRRIPSDHADYDAAQKMAASLQAGGAPGAGPGATVVEGGRAAPGLGGDPVPARLRATAEQALSQKRYIEALRDFHAAAPAFGNDPAFTQAMATASEKVGELTPAVKLYNEGEYETAIPILWRIFQAERDNADARSYLQRAYYNLGVSQLQSGLFPRAIESFNEVMELDPQDLQASRHKKFAERYLKADLDLMGRIYVRHIQPRP
jgi:tetratricopeptide (TPR) repeat protein